MIAKLKNMLRPPSPNAMRQKLIDEAQRDEIHSRQAIENFTVQMHHHQSHADMLARRVARLRREMESQP